MKQTLLSLLGLIVLSMPLAAMAQEYDDGFFYTNTGNAITITGLTNSPDWGAPNWGALTIPDTIDGLPVTDIGGGAFVNCIHLTSVTIPDSVTSIAPVLFDDCYSLTSVTIPASVTNIGLNAFEHCAKLTSVLFQGNAPSQGPDWPVFNNGDPNLTIYYVAGTTGWGPTFDGFPTVLWNPQVQSGSADLGVSTNGFGFTITGTSNMVVVVEACTNLANPAWYPLRTNTLSGGSWYFSDPQWMNYPSRFFRLHWP